MAIDPSAFFNAFICAAIVIVLMFYQRHGARHRPFISVPAYITVLVYAAILCSSSSAFIVIPVGWWWSQTFLSSPPS